MFDYRLNICDFDQSFFLLNSKSEFLITMIYKNYSVYYGII